MRNLLGLAVTATVVVTFPGGGCARVAPAVAPPETPGTAAPDAAEAYLGRLLAGDSAGLRSGFSGEPSLDDPMGGRVRGAVELERFVAERGTWLRDRAARVVPVRVTRGRSRTVVESLIQMRFPDRAVELPIAVVGDQMTAGRAGAMRVYHSLWPIEGKHRVRPPLLPHDPAVQVTDIVATYQHALAAGDVEGIVATFEPDGYFREPSGGVYVHRGPAQLRAFMTEILAAGGVALEHTTLTDDGVVAAIEFNAVGFGPRRITPQAGIAIYERGAGGQLRAARIYDDVNVEVLANPRAGGPVP